MPRLIRQPLDSDLCGQCCVAMAAGVSLKKTIAVFGHQRGTKTREVAAALAFLGLRTATRLKRASRLRPVLPQRAILTAQRPRSERRKYEMWHWLLLWDGKVFDPGGGWPELYKDWRITSYLEIFND